MRALESISKLAMLLVSIALLIFGFMHAGLHYLLLLTCAFVLSVFCAKCTVHLNALFSDSSPILWILTCVMWWMFTAFIIYGVGFLLGYIRLLLF